MNDEILKRIEDIEKNGGFVPKMSKRALAATDVFIFICLAVTIAMGFV